jgi:hypothetical protein
LKDIFVGYGIAVGHGREPPFWLGY